MAATATSSSPPPPPSPSSSPPSLDLSLPLASQPDIVLAAEKDLFYSKQIKDLLTEVLERLLGARKVELLGPEIGLVADLCYYGLTMSTGGQTLGQEYCTLILAKEHQPPPVPVPVPSRLPATEGERGGGESQTLFLLPLSAPRRAMAILGAGSLTYVAQRVLHRGGWQDDWRKLLQGPGVRRPSSQPPPPPSSTPAPEDPNQQSSTRINLSIVWRIRESYRVYYQKVLEALLPESREAALRALQRLHLMLFFLYGRYYTVAWRLAGARTVNTSRVDRRASYTALGVMLAMQMGIKMLSAMGLALKEYMAVNTDIPQEVDASSPDGVREGRVPSGAIPTQSTPSPSSSGEGEIEEDEKKKCSLCMGPRKSPSATPCGHVFCWDCIMNWCQSRPECPLCRHAALPQTIVYVVNFTP